jgi:hypothetical protein
MLLQIIGAAYAQPCPSCTLSNQTRMKERDIGSITYLLNMKTKMTTTQFISNDLLAK